MTMATLQFYRNKYNYPDYINSLSAYGASMECTPVGSGLKNGSIRVRGDMTDFMSCNYLSLTRGGQTLFAWIDNVTFHTPESFIVEYSVDAWRTYRSKINLATQFIRRRPQSTILKDDLLGSPIPKPSIRTEMFNMGSPTLRTFVVQQRVIGAVPFSRSPVQPTPYRFFLINYDVNNWIASRPLEELMEAISGAETKNIVTMYSMPYMDISTLEFRSLSVITASGTTPINGFRMFTDNINPRHVLYNEVSIPFTVDLDKLFRVDHSVQLVIPDAGIINIPDELIGHSDLKLRQDIDLFSGACNYMLKAGENDYFNLSVRGSSISSIPIVSDPLDTYLSQNQNALATSLIGDVATIAGGVGMAAASGGMGAGMGAATAMGGISSIAGRYASIQDAGNRYSNPPAYLGTALASNFSGRFWMVTIQKHVTNAEKVHANFGYAYDLVDDLTFPSSGFIQTQGCSVQTTNGSVPRWAIEEINQRFDNGIMVHTS